MIQISKKKAGLWFSKYWLKLCFAALITLVLVHKDLNLQLNLSGASLSSLLENPIENDQTVEIIPVKQSNTSKSSKNQKTRSQKTSSHTYGSSLLANDYANMTYHDSPSTNQKTSRSKKEKLIRQNNYVKRFAAVAKAEMKKFGIPASITLAQGLIESDAGFSRLAKSNNNHFGMKCFSRKCKKGHCSNFTDDSHKDFFRKYETAWESYRAHSRMLNQKRYRPLHKLGKYDYKAWAKGLKKAGYATDKRYAEKLIHIIEELRLYEYDRS